MCGRATAAAVMRRAQIPCMAQLLPACSTSCPTPAVLGRGVTSCCWATAPKLMFSLMFSMLVQHHQTVCKPSPPRLNPLSSCKWLRGGLHDIFIDGILETIPERSLQSG